MPFKDIALSVDLNFEAMEGMIGNRGGDVVHEKSLKCPCVQVDTSTGAVGHSDPNCEECRGRGYTFHDPTIISGLLVGMTTDRFWSQVGWVQPGDVTLSPSLHARRIGDFDKVTLTVPAPVDSQVITRGTESVVSPRPSELQDNEDMLYWEAGRRQADLMIDEDGNEYRLGEYTLRGRRVVWAPGAGPAKGKKYSIRYEAYVEFIAWATPMDRWDRSREIGQRVMLRRALVDLNPTRLPIRAPWEERVDAHAGVPDPYGPYTAQPKSVFPPR